MNKMKKLFAVVVSVVMVCVFATCAFADTTSNVKAYMLAKGVTVTGTLTKEQAQSLAASAGTLKGGADKKLDWIHLKGRLKDVFRRTILQSSQGL